MPSQFGSATERRLDVSRRRRDQELRAERKARRDAGLPDARASLRSRQPHKANGRDHKAFYKIAVQSGFVLSLLIVTGVANMPLYEQSDSFEVILSDQELIVMEDIVQTQQNQPPPPPPKPAVPVEVPDEVIIENDELDLDASLDLDEYLTDLAPPPAEPEEEEEVEDEIFVVVQDPPVMIGGMAALAKELEYPDFARKAGIEGRVTVEYVVNEEGGVEEPKVLRGLGGGLDEEALRVIRLMKFEPGRQRGRPVKVRVATAVNFRLVS